MPISAAITASVDPHLFLRHRPPCRGRLGCDLQALTVPEFVEPVLLGLIALGAGMVICLAWRFVRAHRETAPSGPIPVAGLLLAAAALAAYQRTGHLVVGLAISVVLLAAGGLVGQIARLPLAARMLLAVPGAAVIATRSALPVPGWARAFAAVITVVGFGLIDDLDRRHDRLGLGPLLLAATLIGIYETVPDPDFVLLLVGAALPLALLAWPRPLARLGGPGAAASAGFLAWADAVGGRGRLGTVVAGAACLGLFAIEPVARALMPRRRTFIERLPRRWWTPIAIACVQLAVVALCSRIALGKRGPVESAEIALASLALAVVAACALSERDFDPAQPDRSPPRDFKSTSLQGAARRRRHLTPR